MSFYWDMQKSKWQVSSSIKYMYINDNLKFFDTSAIFHYGRWHSLTRVCTVSVHDCSNLTILKHSLRHLKFRRFKPNFSDYQKLYFMPRQINFMVLSSNSLSFTKIPKPRFCKFKIWTVSEFWQVLQLKRCC